MRDAIQVAAFGVWMAALSGWSDPLTWRELLVHTGIWVAGIVFVHLVARQKAVTP